MEDISKIKLEKHFISESCSYISELIAPLEQYGITHLTIGTIRNDPKHNGTLELLTSDPTLTSTYISGQYYKDIIGGGPDDFVPCNLLTSSLAKECPVLGQFYSDFKNNHNIANSIDVVRKFDDYCQIYYFASEAENYSVENFYLNNIDLLDQFILKVRDKASGLLVKSAANRLICPGGQDNTLMTSEDWQKKNKLSRPLVTFSNRESECIFYLKQGLRAKAISKQMNNSPRTVEKIIASVKHKFNVKTINQLLIAL